MQQELPFRRETAADRASRAKKLRDQLITEMGGKCEECGRTKKLEFHHKFKRQWTARKTSRWQRMAHYRREFERGVLRLLCSKCNKLAGSPTEHEPDLIPE